MRVQSIIRDCVVKKIESIPYSEEKKKKAFRAEGAEPRKGHARSDYRSGKPQA